MKKISLSKKDIKKFINNTYKSILKYIKYNRCFLSFVILSLISVTFIRCITVGNIIGFKAILFDLSIILLFGSFGYLFQPKNQYSYYLSNFVVYLLICVVNAIYYTFYSSFASFSLLSALGQVGEVGDAVFEKLNIMHFIYLIPLVLFWYINKKLKKRDYYSLVKKIEIGKVMFVRTIIVGFVILVISCSMLSGTAISRLNKQWNREYIVERFGIIVYQGNDLVQTLRSKVNTLFGYDEASRKFVEYYNNVEVEEKDNKYTNIYKDKNIMFMHLESMMTFFVGLEINGVEITPNLNKLTREGLYFSNFYPEIGVGTSSDTEFTVSTSLLPVSSGTVFVSYYDRYYPSIQNLLKDKGYYTFSMHGNKASMWNRNKMHPNLGYTDMFFEESYEIDEVVGLGLSDVSFFRQIIPILTDIETKNDKYMGNIIMLSNHTPFDDLDKYGELDLSYKGTITNEDGKTEEVHYNYLEETKLGNYIKSAHYADMALGQFIDSLYTSDIMDDTLFVMYGDHDAKLSKSEFNYYYNFDFNTGEIKSEEDPTYINYDYYANELNRKTPLILWTKDKKVRKEIKYPMGMIDVMPTVANMIDLDIKYNLGHDIFDIKNENIVPFPNGNFLTEKVYYNASKEEYISLTSEPIDELYIEKCKKYTENIIELSNDIIVYDLIKNEQDRVIK